MMDPKGKELDDFFRKELSNGNIPYEEGNWLRLEKRLKKNKRKRAIVWMTVSGIAAMLLITLSVSKVFFSDKSGDPMATNVKKSDQSNAPDMSDVLPQSQKPYNSQELTAQERRDLLGNPADLKRNLSPVKKQHALATKSAAESQETSIVKSTENQIVNLEDNTEKLSAIKPFNTSDSVGNAVNDPIALADSRPNSQISEDPLEKSEERSSRSGLPLSFAFVAGPDINGVNSLRSNRGGVSFGLLLNYNLSRSLSISTGALYAKKLYNSEFEYYKPDSDYKFPNIPITVNADCSVLDIPLNVNYTAWSRAKNAIAVSAGISSYLMLNEGYSFTYETAATRGPRRYYITNRNKHYLGILNFSAAYERKISDEVSIGFQPYLKLPVTQIGYGNVKLLSTGVLTSVKLNLPTKK